MKILAQGMIRAYQRWLSPMLKFALTGNPRASLCRFEPTCSCYCLQALELHGFWKGTWFSLRRLARCHPWGGSGADPVPGRR